MLKVVALSPCPGANNLKSSVLSLFLFYKNHSASLLSHCSTSRKVKDLWKEKKKQAMTAEEKECLKPLSVKFLSRLLSR